MYFFVSLYLQELVGFSPLRTGLAILPAGTMTLLGALVAPRLVAVIGPRRQLILGPALAAAGLLWMSTLSFGTSQAAMLIRLKQIGLAESAPIRCNNNDGGWGLARPTPKVDQPTYYRATARAAVS